MNFIKSLFKEKSGQANLSASAPPIPKLELGNQQAVFHN